MTARDESAIAAGTVIDGYRIEALIGRGGMGEVYRADDTALHRPVALKIVSRVLCRDPNFVARFQREARAASAVNHPNVAQIHAFGMWDERPYFVMEYVAGRSLADIVRRDGRRSGSGAVRLIQQAAEGLKAASECGVIHRDVKPANLVVDSHGRLKIVDFGLARRQGTTSDLTRADMVLGTPAFMSPEQALSHEVDFRSDIYSLGATFYYLLAGQPPFDGETPIAVMMRHVHDPLPPIRELNPLVPEHVAAVIERMLAKRPDNRYGSWDDVLIDLAAARTRPPRRAKTSAVEAPQEGRPSIALIAAAAVVILLAGVIAVHRLLAPPASPMAAAAAPAPIPAEDGPLPDGASPPPAGDPGGNSPTAQRPRNTFEAIIPALNMAHAAQTLSNMRRVDTAVQVYLAQNGVLPSSLDELASWYEIHPAGLVDSWHHRILYQPRDPGRYRIRSLGPDGAEGSADDIVIENGYVIQGEPTLPGQP